MAELTTLDEKLAEVLRLAQAAQTATKKVATLARKEKETDLLELMEQMGDEAAELEVRCDAVAGSREGMRTAITKRRAARFNDPGVIKDPSKADDGVRLSPVLVLSGKTGADTADGFHRVCTDSTLSATYC